MKELYLDKNKLYDQKDEIYISSQINIGEGFIEVVDQPAE
jgi:hypothetical protein